MKTETLLRFAFRLAEFSYLIIAFIGIWIGERLITSVAWGFFGIFVVIEYLIWRNRKLDDA